MIHRKCCIIIQKKLLYIFTQMYRKLYSASADQSVIVWDLVRNKRIRKYKEHSGIVNSVSSTAVLTHQIDPTKTENLFVSGSDDRYALVFDIRTKESISTLSCKYPVLSVAMGENEIFTAGVDEVIRVWDMRTNSVSYTMPGHTDSITGLKLNSDGTSLLSAGMDNTLRTWDVRPFLPSQGGDSARCTKVFNQSIAYGPDKNLLRCAWSPDSTRVSSGCSDTPTHVHIWDSRSGSLLYKLPGHRGTVNEVDFHPIEPIIASASSDHTIFVGEIAPK